MNTQTLTFSVIPELSTDSDITRFSGVAYSGGLIPGYGFYGDAAIDLESISLPGEIFALVDHDPTQRAGKGSVSKHNNQLIFSGEIFKSTKAGQEVAALFKEGAPWQMSVGIQSKPDYSKAPRTVNVNQQQLTINTIFKNASIREVSFVPVGADPNTHVAAFSFKTQEANPMEIEELQEQIAELQAKLQEQTERADTAERQLHDIKLAKRKSLLDDMLADAEISDDIKATLLTVADEQFEAMVKTFGIFKTKPVDESLTQEFAINGQSVQPQEDMQQLNSKLRSQVAGGN